MFFSASSAGETNVGAVPRPPSPTRVGDTAFADGNTTSATPDASGLGLTAKDVLLCMCHLAGGGDGVFASAPGGEGWTRLQDVEDTGGNNSAMSVFWKRWGDAGQTDDSTPTFTAAAGSLGAVITVWRGCNSASSPFTATPGTNHGNTGTTLTGGAATAPATNNSAQVFFGCLTPAGNISSVSGSFYSSAYAGGSYATTAGPDRAVASAYNTNVPSGSTGGGVTGTATATMTAWTSITIILDAEL